MERCAPVGHTSFQPLQKQQLRQRIEDALHRAFPPASQCMPVSRATSEISRLGYPTTHLMYIYQYYKCYMGFWTPRRTLMHQKKKKEKKTHLILLRAMCRHLTPDAGRRSNVSLLSLSLTFVS